MTLSKSLPWILLVGVIASDWLAARNTQGGAQPEELLRVKRLEITGVDGRSRIVMTTDVNGIAKIIFVDNRGREESEIAQDKDGVMSLRFAGLKGQPSVILESGLYQGGPRFLLRGSTWPEQRILLGFHTDDAPSDVSRVWGLFLPSLDGFHNLSAIGAARDLKTGRTQGFVAPSQ